MERRCGPPPDRYRLGCAAPRGPKGVLYLCRPMASNSTLQRPTAQRRRRRRRNPKVCGGERGQPIWITGAFGPGRRGLHARGSAEPALPCSSPIRLQAKYIVSQSDDRTRSKLASSSSSCTDTTKTLSAGGTMKRVRSKGGMEVKCPRNRVVVRVPATTANMGPGFDALGMGIDIWNEISVERAGSFSIETEGEGVGRM